MATTTGMTSSLRKLLGFQKTASFGLFILTGGIMLFWVASLLREYYNSFDEYFRYSYAAGAAYLWMKVPKNRALMISHLATTLPCGALSVLQFIPVLQQRKYAAIHRFNGYIVLALCLPGAASGLMLSKTAFGGDFDTKTSCLFFFTYVVTTGVQGWLAAKRLQLDEHRKWMLRCMITMASIITVRAIVGPSMQFVSDLQNPFPCDELADLFTIIPGRDVVEEYPVCANLTNIALVPGIPTTREGIAAAARIVFGATIFMSVILHAVAVEIYISFTPERSRQLRLLSEKRQKEAGMLPASEGRSTQ